jgi:hypothetical protein
MGKKGYENRIGAMLVKERMAASEKGYKNGLGAMSAEEKTAAYENGIGAMSAKERIAAYENGIGSMSAKERMAASKKGNKNGLGAMSAEENKMRMGIVWEEKYAEFKRCVGMPEIGTQLHNWQKNQLGNTHASCLNAKIQKEIEENEGSICREWRVKLSDCVVQKNRAKIGNAWEEKYAEFESYGGMPKKGTPLYNRQQNQLSNSHASNLNAKIRKEHAENKGSTIWSEQRVKLANSVEQKRRE